MKIEIPEPLLTKESSLFDKASSSRGRCSIPRVFENLWTVTDLAQYLRVSEKTVYDWVHKREVPFQKVNRLVRFKPSEIEKWLNSKGESHYGDR